MTDPVGPPRSEFRAFLWSAGRLAVARQLSGLLFVGVVLVLPALADPTTVTDFVWSYFAMLTITSVLGLGFERLAGSVVGEHRDEPRSAVLAPVLVLRVATLPLAALALWLFLAFVRVDLPAGAWCGTVVWIVAALVAPTAYGALRADGNAAVEPTITMLVRVSQAVVLLALTLGDMPLWAMVGGVAALEVLGAVVATRAALRSRWEWPRPGAWREVPIRRASALAGIEVMSLAYLRADLLIVGRMLGAGPGATYGLLYRVVDGVNGLIGSAALWLYAESANQREGAADPAGLRARTLALLPNVAIGVSLGMIVLAGGVADVVPRLGGEIDTLRILIGAFPLLAWNAIELHVRSGRLRNREVLRVGAMTLALNIPLCIVLIGHDALKGAAVALVISELWQAGLLLASASKEERLLLLPSFSTSAGGTVLLVITGVSIGAGQLLVAGLCSISVAAVAARGLLRRGGLHAVVR